MKHIKLFEQFLSFINEGITSETDKVANEFKKELVDMKKHFGSRLKDNEILWDGAKKVMGRC